MADLSCLEERLLQVPNQHAQQMHRILQWLAFADGPFIDCEEGSRPQLSVALLVETTKAPSSGTSFWGAPPRLSLDDIIKLLAGIAESNEFCHSRSYGDEETVNGLQLVKSVRDELLSERFRQVPLKASHAENQKEEESSRGPVCLSCSVIIRSGPMLQFVLPSQRFTS